ncbi:MAG: prepilin-type N-terminal cleavage/methylation domain-containing protein [Verrucomicrobia bacterium]|nr:prepilin-type N-terminal cleavage/methylation domain-containing protein [Verrucomicrobiota bacterium]
MNPDQTGHRGRAFTMIEMLCVIGIIAILAALLLPALNQGKSGAKRIQCVGNLKQAGIAFHSFAHDHRGRFPMQLPTRDGGSEEFVKSGYRVGGEFYFSFRHFQSLSNELVSPKILVCPADSARWPAVNFAKFDNVNLSYFVGVNAEQGNVNSILSGDRNLSNERGNNPTILQPGPGSSIRWTRELHEFKGNLLYADGRVEEVNSLRFLQNKKGDEALFLPSTNQPGAAAFPGNTALAVARQFPNGSARSNSGRVSENPDLNPRTTATRIQPANGVLTSLPSVTDTAPAKPETNSMVVATQAAPTRTAHNSGDSPFMRWFADMAQQIVDWAKWLLWLLLLLLLIALVAVRLRELARRKSK